MLIRFRVSNFLSFKDEAELSMIAGTTLNHPEHVLPLRNSKIDILRCAAVYGANASGKSNLIKAAEFAQKFIVNGIKRDEKISLKSFKLVSEYAKKPSKFEFEFFVSGKCYLYGFELTPTIVISEWLYEIKKTTEKMLFERKTEPKNKVKIELGIKLKSKTDQVFLEKFSEGTRNNQLFLVKCFEDENIHSFDAIVKWFIDLEFVFPTTKYKRFPIEVERGSKILKDITHFLQKFDTGVCRFETKEMNPEGVLPKEILDDIQSMENGYQAIINNSKGEFFLSRKDKDQEIPKWSKIVFIHQVNDCESEITFDMDEESDGTLRLIDLIPMLLLESKTILVDEIDRSIHPALIYRFVELFLSNKKNSQFIFTTHEDHLLDQELLRRDEIWFVEKDQNGASSLYSLEEFAPRKDLDIQKGYLMGRFGAIPLLGDCNFLEE
ncbi:MAG: AAA family ATPase [Anaerolineaceae bacterium]